MAVSFRLIRDERWEKVTKNRHFGRELWRGARYVMDRSIGGRETV